MWPQTYDPLGNVLLSTLCAAAPVVVLLGALGLFRVRAHLAAMLGLAAVLVVAIAIFGMPARMAAVTAVYGAAYGLFPIGWIVVNVIFLYGLTHERGLFDVLRESIAAITADRRLQLLLVAFCFGAFFEGAAGFGTPVAVTAAILIGLGFPPLAASGLSLIANTAPVAFGALGTPIIALQGVTGLPLRDLSAMVGRQLPPFAFIVPFWLVWAFAGARGLAGVWPAVAVAGIGFAIPQFLVSNFHGPWLVDVVSALVSLGATVLLLKVWQPADRWESVHSGTVSGGEPAPAIVNVATLAPSAVLDRRAIIRAWTPWIILSVVVFAWGVPQVKALLDGWGAVNVAVPGLHLLVARVPPVVAQSRPEAAIFAFNWLSASGTGILIAALIGGYVMGYSTWELIVRFGRTLRLVRYSLLTIAAMMAVGYTSRYAGLDATMGLAFARTGVLYPLFGTMLGWLGVALTGSDTSSNVLFGSLQRITAEQLALSPTLMAAANSAGGVMGKMIDAQSIVVASTATRWYGHEGDILRYVFLHSLVLALLVGLLVLLQAYVPPFTSLVVR